MQKGCGGWGGILPPRSGPQSGASPFPLASPLARPGAPSVPCLSPSERRAPEFPLSPGPLLSLASSQECQSLVIAGICVGSTLQSQPPSLTDPCPLARGAQLPPQAPPLWDSVSPGLLTTPRFCRSASLGLCPPPAAHGSDTLQDTVVPLLSAQLCNSSCVYGGALTPRMLCAGYLDGRADACQVWRPGQCWRAGAGGLV